MVSQPDQRFARRSAIPPSKSKRPVINNKSSRLRPVEQTLYILINESHLWHLVDEFRGEKKETSAMEAALRRRGATIRRLPYHMEPGLMQVWAKWEHDIPRDVSPWVVRHNAKATGGN